MRILLAASTIGFVVCIGCNAVTQSEDGEKSGPTPGILKPTPDAGKLEIPIGTTPDVFRVQFETSNGKFIVEVHRDWAPIGADRFYKLVKTGYFDGCRFFRVVPGFVAQFGIHGDPKVYGRWRYLNLPDDNAGESNVRGTITFATSGSDTRTCQLFINLKDNTRLNSMGFTPFGKVVKGMSVVANLYDGYGEKPDQTRLTQEGNAYLTKNFPLLDSIEKAFVLEPPSKKPEPKKTAKTTGETKSKSKSKTSQ